MTEEEAQTYVHEGGKSDEGQVKLISDQTGREGNNKNLMRKKHQNKTGIK